MRKALPGLVLSLALAAPGCHLAFPFHVGDAGAGVGDSAFTELSIDGPGVGIDADAGVGADADAGSGVDAPTGPVDQGTEKTWPDASISKRAVWVKTFGGTGTEELNDIAVASSGTIHVVGSFTGTFDIDGKIVDATGLADQILVVTLNSSGNCQWAKAFGGPSEDSARAVDVSSLGDIFVAGNYLGTLDLKTSQSPHTAVNKADIFFVKIAANGAPQASASLGGDGSDTVTDLILDGSGHVALTGYFDSSSFKTGTKTISRGNSTVAGFIGYYKSPTAALWSAPIAGSGHLYPRALATDGNIELYIAGYYSGSADLDGDILANTGGGTKESFIASFETNANGVPHWGYNAGNIPYYDYFYGITRLPTQQIVMAGYFKGKGTYGTHTVTGVGNEDGVLALFDTPSSSEIFTKAWRMGGVKNDRAVAVTNDGQGNIYVTGFFQESADMGGGATLTSNKLSQDLFVASYTSAGVHRWSERFGGNKTDSASAIAFHNGHVYVVGTFAGQAQFGPFSRAAVGSSDVFVLKLNAGP